MGKEYSHSSIIFSVKDKFGDVCCMFVYVAEYEEEITSQIPSN